MHATYVETKIMG